MEKQEIYNIGLDMVYLAACSIHGRLPEKARLEKMNFAHVYKMAKRHSMQAIVYILIAKCREEYGENIIDAELFEKWKASYHEVLNRLVRFDIEREKLCGFLEENNIWYLCLKGVVLQHYYPTLGMRQMTDNDILVDPKTGRMIRDYMTEQGYSIYSYGSGCHDTYCKGNLTFEIHRKLFSDAPRTRQGFNYYSNVKNRLVKGERSNELLFTDEDFYVYFICHANKHFAIAGCGVRTLMDIFLYCSKNEGNLDEKYIEEELNTLGIADYERKSRELAFKIFSAESIKSGNVGEDLADEEIKMLSYYIFSGTFGTVGQMVENSVADMTDGKPVTFSTKLRYLISRVFPDRNFYRDNYPRAGKYLIAIPFLWIGRIFRAMPNLKKHAVEIDTLKKME